MGFYGNATNTSRIHFQFDKIYPNRYSMDSNMVNDGIYPGRFILISYDYEGNLAGNFKLGFNDNPTDKIFYADYEKTKPYYYGTFTLVQTPFVEALSQYYWERNGFYYPVPSSETIIRSEQTYYLLDNRDRFPNLAAINNVVSKGTILRRGTERGSFDQYYVSVDIDNLRTLQSGDIALWDFALTDDFDSEYFRNYNIDILHYGKTEYGVTNIGYDNTVWQKIWGEGQERYVLVAKLNSNIPSFELYADAPTDPPRAPYIDGASANSIYRFHLQEPWGFRLAKADDEAPSDLNTLWHLKTQSNMTGELLDSEQGVRAKVFFNKDGFNPEISNISDYYGTNEINLTDTGYSGRLYRDDNEIEPKEKIDTKELSIILPGLGNAVAEMYDTIYGKDPNTHQRYRDISWYYLKNGEADYRQTGNPFFGGKTYDLNTVAGSINTIHNKIGQIIEEIDYLPTDIIEIDANFTDDIIYHLRDTSRYYRKGKGYNYTEIEYYFEPINLTEQTYVPNTYYIGSEHIPDITKQFQSDVDYYQRVIQTETFEEADLIPFELDKYFVRKNDNLYLCDRGRNGIPVYTQRHYSIEVDESDQLHFSVSYSPNAYFYKDEFGNLIKETALEPRQNIQYFRIGETTGFSQVLFYIPNTYYWFPATDPGIPHLDESTDYSSRIGSSVSEEGHFYLQLGEPELRVDPISREVIQAYKILNKIRVNLQEYPSQYLDNENKALYIQDENGNYINTNTDIQKYLGFKLGDTIEYRDYVIVEAIPVNDLYIPGKYWYQDETTLNWQIDISAKFNSNRDYYMIHPIQLTKDFYIPGKYYQLIDHNYILDPADYNENIIYYKKANFYVTNDKLYECPYGLIWNYEVKVVPWPLTLCKRTEYSQLIEIDGFNTDENSINRYLLLIENKLAPNDEDIRDKGTIQGSLNSINDRLYSFDELLPNKILYVNKFGRIQSSQISLTDLVAAIDPNESTVREYVLSLRQAINALTTRCKRLEEEYGLSDEAQLFSYVVPYIGEDNHWFIGDEDTGIIAGDNDSEKDEFVPLSTADIMRIIQGNNG